MIEQKLDGALHWVERQANGLPCLEVRVLWYGVLAQNVSKKSYAENVALGTLWAAPQLDSSLVACGRTVGAP